jgi:hypothetical protein
MQAFALFFIQAFHLLPLSNESSTMGAVAFKRKTTFNINFVAFKMPRKMHRLLSVKHVYL